MELQQRINIHNPSKRSVIDKIIFLLIVVLFSSFYIFESYAWGKYVLAVVAITCFGLTLIRSNARVILRIHSFHYFVFTFALYCLFSSLWALNAWDSISKFSTIIQILICFSLLYICFNEEDCVEHLLNAIMWGGYVVCVYSFFVYGGFSNVISMVIGGARLDNDYTNVNSIGLVAAFSCILQFYKILNKKISASVIFVVPAFIMILATQSRKALVLLVLGLIASYILKNSDNKNIMITIAKVIVGAVVAILVFYAASKLPIFEGINKRMEGLIASLTGKGVVDHSTWLRQQFKEVGWNQFLQTPIGGIGIGCSHYLTAAPGVSTYLHNNYVELLACGGIVGFCLYYSIYAYLLINLIKYRKLQRTVVDICLVILVLLLIMDYGMVSYYSKRTYFYFMMFFIEVQNLKKSKRPNDHTINRSLIPGI